MAFKDSTFWVDFGLRERYGREECEIVGFDRAFRQLHGSSVGEAPAQHKSHCPDGVERDWQGRTGTPGLRVFLTWLRSVGPLTVRGAEAWTSGEKMQVSRQPPCGGRSDTGSSFLPLRRHICFRLPLLLPRPESSMRIEGQDDKPPSIGGNLS